MHPALGAFLTRDPFEGVINRSLSRNAHAYAEDNPVNYTDPSGLFVNPLGGPIGAGIGAVAGGAGAFGMHRLALSGACGCELQHWAEQTNPWDLALKGAITGGIVGGLSGLFPMFAGEIAAAAGGVGFGASVVDLAQNGLNLCNAVGTAASVGGGLSGRSSFSASMTDMTISVSVNIGGAALRNFAVSTTAVVVSGGAAAVSGALGGTAFFSTGRSKDPCNGVRPCYGTQKGDTGKNARLLKSSMGKVKV